VFDRYAAAQRAVQVLQDSGFGPDAVHITEDTDAGYADRVDAQGEPRREDEGLTAKIRHFFADLFGPDDEREVSQYSAALKRGCAVVKVDVEEDDKVDAARQALQSAGAVDIEEEAAGLGSRDRDLSADRGTAGASYPVVEDEVGVGSSQSTYAGGVRVYPGDRAYGQSAAEREQGLRSDRGTMEGQLGQGSDASTLGRSDMSQSMGGSGLSSQEMRNEDIGSAGLGGSMGSANVGQSLGGTMGMDTDYRTHFDSNYGSLGERYDDYEPAYRYGSTLAGDSRYTGRSWDEFESDARIDWESAHPGSAWERFKGAVRHAWERATH
jgi:hypothetical protein